MSRMTNSLMSDDAAPSTAPATASTITRRMHNNKNRPSFLVHTIDDPEPLIWSGPLADEPFGRALLNSLPSTPAWITRNTLRSSVDHRNFHFVNAHAAAPVCQPSRWSLLTGRFASAGTLNGSASVFFNMRPVPRSTSLPGLLQRHGYATGHFGKYHAHYLPGISYSELTAGVKSIGFGTVGALYPGNLYDGPIPVKEHLPEWIIYEARAWLERTLSSGYNPFFASVNPTLEHAPFAPSLCSLSWKTPNGQWSPTGAQRDEIRTRRQAIVKRLGMRCNDIETLGRRLKPANARPLPGVHRLAVSLWQEDGLAQLLETLSKQNALTNTMIINLGDHGVRLKGSVHTAARIPFSIRWDAMLPAVPSDDSTTFRADRILRHPISTVDVAPTIIHAAGLHEVPMEIFDGLSLLPLLPLVKPLQPPPKLHSASSSAAATTTASITDRDGVLIEMCSQRAIVHRSGWKLITTRLTEANQRRFGCRTERFPIPSSSIRGVATRACNVPSTLPSRSLEGGGLLSAAHAPWVQHQHECEEVIAGGHQLRPLSQQGIRWAKWWVPGSQTLDTFGNSSSLDAEQFYSLHTDPLELRNRRNELGKEGAPQCAREAFCLQASLKLEVLRTASRPLHAHGAIHHHGGVLTRRGEHSAMLLLARSGQEWAGVAGMNRTKLIAAAKALGCGAEKWEGAGWCAQAR